LTAGPVGLERRPDVGLGSKVARCNAVRLRLRAPSSPQATGSTYTPPAADLGSTLRVQETAATANGAGAPADSTQDR